MGEECTSDGDGGVNITEQILVLLKNGCHLFLKELDSLHAGAAGKLLVITDQ